MVVEQYHLPRSRHVVNVGAAIPSLYSTKPNIDFGGSLKTPVSLRPTAIIFKTCLQYQLL